MSDFLKLRLRSVARFLCGAAMLAVFTPGAASAGERAGVLQCRLSGNNLTVLIENQAIDCTYQDEDEGAGPAHYVGTITKVGANITINGPGEVAWGVVAATDRVGPGALAGDYAGPGTTAKVGIGGGGALLVGGSNNTFSLQPLEIEAGTGLGFTVGVQSLHLVFAPDLPPPAFVHHYRHQHHKK